MKEIEIIVSTSEVMLEAQRELSYLGAKSADPTAFSRVELTDYDDMWVKNCMTKALGLITPALGEYLKECNTTDKEHKLEVGLPDNAHPSSATLGEQIKDFYVKFVLAEWILIADPQRLEAYAQQPTAQLQTIVNLINMRKKPV